ncbi:MAG: hypothetical protein HRU36_00600 [Rickettsiales bacterium]|nr:hypothetical protein [Rickettsiales bacterium]
MDFNGGIIRVDKSFVSNRDKGFLNTGIIIAGEDIRMHNIPFFQCQNGEMSAKNIFFPYKKNVELENCKISGNVYYLDINHKEDHLKDKDIRYFEEGIKLIGNVLVQEHQEEL